VRIDEVTRVDAVQLSRQGIERALEQADRAAESIARVPPSLDEQQRLEQAREMDRQDYVRDLLDLAEARHNVALNAQVARIGIAASAEVVNLGRRIDVSA
jgi:hypothetical protein